MVPKTGSSTGNISVGPSAATDAPPGTGAVAVTGRIRLPSNSVYQNSAAHAMSGSRMLIPVLTCSAPLNAPKDWEQQILAKIKETTGCEWNIQFVEVDGKVHAEIRESVSASIALNFLLQGANRFISYTFDHYDKIDQTFAAIANPICEEFEQLWLTHTNGLAQWSPDLSGLSNFNCDASRGQYAQFVQDLLAGDSFCLGEIHEHLTPTQFMAENVDLFKSAGFTTLYLEGLNVEAQGELDVYLNAPSGTQLPPRLNQGFLANAKAAGLRVVGIDSNFANSSTLGKSDQSNWQRSRVAAFNCCAVQIIQADETNRQGGKFIVFVGSDHLGFADASGSITGIAQFLQVKSVCIADIDESNQGDSPPAFALVTADQKHKLSQAVATPWAVEAAGRPEDIVICAWSFERMHASENPPVLPRRKALS